MLGASGGVGAAETVQTGAVTPVPAAAAPPAWEMPADQRAALLALADQAVALGMPDARAGTLHRGELKVSWLQPQADGTTQPRTLIVPGIHVRMADGSWLVTLDRLLVPRAGITIDTRHMEPLTTAEFVKTVRASPAGFSADEFLERSSPPWSTATQTMLRGSIPASTYIRQVSPQHDGSRNLLAASIVGLMRLGIPHAEHLVVIMGCSGSFAGESGSGTQVPYLALGSTSRHRRQGFPAPQDTTEVEPPARDLPTPSVILRQGCSAWFRAQLIGLEEPFTVLALERALTGTQATTDPGDAGALAELARLAARARLSEQAPAGADLAARLASWDGTGGPEGRSSSVWFFPEEPRDEPMGDSTDGPSAGTAAFTATDFAALVELTGDTRASRWLEQDRVHTVGDQALRAIASLLGFDPRILIKRDPDAPWDDAERQATARSLQAWWGANRQRPLPETLIIALPELPAGAILAVMRTVDATHRDRCLTRLAEAWMRPPPAEILDDLGPVLVAGRHHTAFCAAVDGWPVSGAARLRLAVWQLWRGHRQAFDACLEAALGATPDEHAPLDQILPVLYRTARPADLQRFQTLLVGPLDQDAGLRLVTTLLSYPMENQGGFLDALTMPAKPGRTLRSPEHDAVPLALLSQLLGDPRPLPASLRERLDLLAGQRRRYRPQGRVRTDEKPKQPADLRCADAGAMSLGSFFRSHLRGDDGHDEDDARFDPFAPISERDAAIQVMARRLHPLLAQQLKDAHLPTVVPGLDSLLLGTTSDRSLF